jgi:hypothetical protein
VFLTEGGVTLSNIASRYGITDPAAQRAKQADLIRRNWARMAPDAGEGAGIAGFAEAVGATRPAFDAWSALPSNR